MPHPSPEGFQVPIDAVMDLAMQKRFTDGSLDTDDHTQISSAILKFLATDSTLQLIATHSSGVMVEWEIDPLSEFNLRVWLQSEENEDTSLS